MHDITIIYVCSLRTPLLCILRSCMHDMVTIYLYCIMFTFTTLSLYTCILIICSHDYMFKLRVLLSMHDMTALYFMILVCTTFSLYTYAPYLLCSCMFHIFMCLLLCIHMLMCFIYYAFNYDEIWLGERPSYSPLTVAVIIWLIGTGWCLFWGIADWLASIGVS